MSINWSRLENFIGYGREESPVVFIGKEEGFGPNIRGDLTGRSAWTRIMDLRDAAGKDPDHRFTEHIRCQRTWRPMCHLMLRREGVAQPDLAARSQYQAGRLGRKDSETLLAELFPFPQPRAKAWEGIPPDRYASRSDYEAKLLPRRIDVLQDALASAKRELVVCYTTECWPAFKQLFGGARWTRAPRGLPIETAKVGQMRVLLTPAFSSRFFNSGDNLQAFSDFALR